MTDETRPTIATVERAADVLALFTRPGRPDLGVTQIATELGLSKAVVHRVLTTLVTKHLVTTDAETRRYRLGPAALALGVAYMDRLDVRALAQPHLRELSRATNETATLSQRDGWRRVYIDQVTPPREVRMSVVLGRPFPLHAGSSSKAFLAFLRRDERERYLDQPDLERLTDRTLVDRAQLERELDLVRERGYAISFGERQSGAGSLAAPVLDHRDVPVAAISVCGPLERFATEVEEFTTLVLAEAAALSRQLGHRDDV